MNKIKRNMTMKKLLFSALVATTLFASCSNEENTLEQYGMIHLDMDDISISAVQTRAGETTGTDGNTDTSTYTYQVLSGNTTVSDTKGNTSFTLTEINSALFSVGSYDVTAESCTEDAANTSNSNWGNARYYGKTAQPLAITAGNTTTGSIACSMSNCKATITFDTDKMDYYFNSGYTVKLSDGTKTLDFDTSPSGKTAYFNTGKTLTLMVTGIPKESSATTATTFSATAVTTTEAGKCYNLTVVASSSKGNFTISATVDTTTTPVNSNVTIDPYPTTSGE
jgi:hypothetical protein